jgi:hypothetical protein
MWDEIVGSIQPERPVVVIWTLYRGQTQEVMSIADHRGTGAAEIASLPGPGPVRRSAARQRGGDLPSVRKSQLRLC